MYFFAGLWKFFLYILRKCCNIFQVQLKLYKNSKRERKKKLCENNIQTSEQKRISFRGLFMIFLFFTSWSMCWNFVTVLKKIFIWNFVRFCAHFQWRRGETKTISDIFAEKFRRLPLCFSEKKFTSSQFGANLDTISMSLSIIFSLKWFLWWIKEKFCEKLVDKQRLCSNIERLWWVWARKVKKTCVKVGHVKFKGQRKSFRMNNLNWNWQKTVSNILPVNWYFISDPKNSSISTEKSAIFGLFPILFSLGEL